ncbi:hypothetical protein L6164_027497 [Bauhinia variegata]|uniref:Uncharacterized protein n=1 Tax=Bauhinia variegata TaxID=167791 RepID=A0ACB9LUL1_BAUVA|nr:hypothetical protein L6164_027497 [Bauhinia variegata]
MEKSVESGGNASVYKGIGSRHFDLKKSFKFALRSLLTSCSKEEFYKAFPRFTNAEKEGLHRLFLQVITSLHENLEDEFESICLETQVAATLDSVEQIVEEQELDPLFSDKSNRGDVAKSLYAAKKTELQHLTRMVKLVEDRNHVTRAHVQRLKDGTQVLSGPSDAVKKFRSWNLNYGASNYDGVHDA